MSKQLEIDRVRSELENIILAGDLAPGQRLNELALAARFESSRGVLREAVRALEEARLVDVIPNRGAVVRKLDLADALELFEVRAGLARAAGRLASLRASRGEIGELQRLHRLMEEAAAAGEATEFQRLNLQFHTALFDAAANKRLREIDLIVRNEMQLYIRQNVASDAQMRVSLAEHGSIVDSLKNGDCDACASAFERHILNGKQRAIDAASASRNSS